MKKRTKIAINILLLANFSTLSLFACDCSDSVTQNYEKIKEKIPSRFEDMANKLSNIDSELDKTITEKEKELKLLEKQLDIKTKFYIQDKQELFQLSKMYDYYSLQNDISLVSANTNMQEQKSVIFYNEINTREFLNKETANFLKK